MAGNKEIQDFPPVPNPDGSFLYVIKNGLDYKVTVGGPLGLVSLDATGVMPVPAIPDLDAAKIVSGAFNAARIPTLDASKIGTGVFSQAQIPYLDATWLVSGLVNLAHIPFLPASHITSGVFPPARLGTGTANSTTFLRGDGVYAVPAAAAASWGSITGTLSSQTDLQTALNTKAPVTTTVTTDTAQTVTGTKSFTDLNVLGNFGRKNANSGTITNQPRIFVQAGDPGAAAAENDIWLW